MALTEAKGASLRLDDDLASSAAGKGASLVALEDSAGNFTSTNVEGALAELFGAVEGFLRSTVDTAVSLTVSAPADSNKLFHVTSTATITLPAAATAGEGFVLAIFNASTVSTDVVTVDAGSEFINNSLSVDLAQGDWCVLTCTGTQWKALIYSPPVASAGGGGGASTKVDPFLQEYGDGSDGAFNSIGASTLPSILSQHTTFALNIGHTLTIDIPVAIIKADTSITIDGTINARGVDITPINSDLALSIAGGAGSGGGGSGGISGPNINTTNGDSGVDSKPEFFVPSVIGGSGGGENVSGANGQSGAVVQAADKKLIKEIIKGYLVAPSSGANGGKGGDFTDTSLGTSGTGGAGGTGGKSGALLILIAPSITINASAVISLDGQDGGNGVSGSSNAGGGGGGGGGCGGVLLLASPSIVNSGTVSLSGGSGGSGGSVSNGNVFGGAGGNGSDGYILTVDPTA